MKRLLSAVLLCYVVVLGQLCAEERVISFNWSRSIGDVSIVSSGKRVYWPGIKRSHWKWLERSGIDLRHFKPPGATERYWIVTTSGREMDLTLPAWSRLDKGSPIK